MNRFLASACILAATCVAVGATIQGLDLSSANTAITGPLVVANGGTNDTGTSWTTYTPTVSSLAGTITTASATGRFKTLGKTVWVQIAVTITTNGTGSSAVTATLPVSLPSSGVANYALAGYNATTAKLLAGLATLGAATRINIFQYDGTYPAASGDTLIITGTYESP